MFEANPIKVRRYRAKDIIDKMPDIKARIDEEKEYEKKNKKAPKNRLEYMRKYVWTNVWIPNKVERMNRSLLLDDLLENKIIKFNKRAGRITADIIKVDFEYSKEEDMMILYNGFTIFDNAGIHKHDYLPLGRSAGGAKKGCVYFIRADKRKRAVELMNMRTKMPRNGSVFDITARMSYSFLYASDIEDSIILHPHEVLILEDVDFFKTMRANVVYADKDGLLKNKTEDANVESSLFDGEGLIQYNMTGVKDKDGFVLLRHQYTKCCAFKADIKLFMKDYFGKEYNTATINDCFGQSHDVRSIKLIMCKSSVKWTKYEKEFNSLSGGYSAWEVWHDAVIANGNKWGVVKSGHDSKFGDLGECNYQIINSLYKETTEKLYPISAEYLEELKTNIIKTVDALETDFNNYYIIKEFYNTNPDLLTVSEIEDNVMELRRKRVRDIKNGRPLLHGHYLTICGNPIALLRHAVGEAPTDAFVEEDNLIQCYCPRFKEDYLGGARSPHNSRNNLVGLHNVKHPELERYMHTGNNVIIVNQKSEFQPRTNGSDTDGDTLYTCSDYWFFKDCERAMIEDDVVVNSVDNSKKKLHLTLSEMAEVDYIIKLSQKNIGSSSNLAQICLTYYWETREKKYYDYCIILAIVAQIAIDGAKKMFDCDVEGTIKTINKDVPDELPFWWNDVTDSSKKDELLGLKEHSTSLSYLANIRVPKYEREENPIPTHVAFAKPEISWKLAENARSFVTRNGGIIDACKARINGRLNYDKADKYHFIDEAEEAERKRIADEFGESMFGADGAVTKTTKSLYKYADVITVVEYILYYVLCENRNCTDIYRYRCDVIWILLKALKDKDRKELLNRINERCTMWRNNNEI